MTDDYTVIISVVFDRSNVEKDRLQEFQNGKCIGVYSCQDAALHKLYSYKEKHPQARMELLQTGVSKSILDKSDINALLQEIS